MRPGPAPHARPTLGRTLLAGPDDLFKRLLLSRLLDTGPVELVPSRPDPSLWERIVELALAGNDGRPLGLVGSGPGAEAVLRAAAELRDAVGAVVGIGASEWVQRLRPVTAPFLLIAPRGERGMVRANRRARRRLGIRGSVQVVPALDRRAAALASAWVADHIQGSPETATELRAALTATRSCRARRVAVGLAPAALLGIGSLTAAPAAASSLCDVDLKEAVLTIDCADSDGAEIHLSTSESKILLNGAPVGENVTVQDVDLIEVTGGAGPDRFTIDETAGIFGPGATPEDDVGRSEIEFTVDLGGGEDLFTHLGMDDGADIIKLGSLGIDPGGDGDVDVKVMGAEEFVLDGQGGGDVLDASGSEATGDPFPFGVKMLGGLDDDVLIGGSEGDVLDGDLGDDQLDGGSKDDILIGGPGFNVLDGGDGVDLIQQKADADFELTDDLLGIKYDDFGYTSKLVKVEQAMLTGGESNNLLDASLFTGPLILEGMGGADVLLPDINPPSPPSGPIPIPYPNVGMVLDGGEGFDTFKQKVDADYLLTDDSLQVKIGGESLESKVIKMDAAELTGGESSNVFDASASKQIKVRLDGLGGDDTLIGGALDDLLLGGEGSDIIKLAGDTDVKVLEDKQIKGLGTDTFDEVEGLKIQGGESGNTLDAAFWKYGPVTLEGLGGNDVLIGGALDDVLIGGDGFDAIKLDGVSSFKMIDFKTMFGFGTDTFDGIEELGVGGSPTDDVLDARLFPGGAVFDGGLGDDVLIGGPFDDVLRGGDGFDIIKMGGDTDFKVLEDKQIKGLGTDTFDEVEGLKIQGGESANKIDVSEWKYGPTTLEGLGGDDVLIGSPLPDVLDGGEGFDRIKFDGDADMTLADDAFTVKVEGSEISDVLVKVESAHLTDGPEPHIMDASAFKQGPVVLDGGGGNDTLLAGFGDDKVTPGPGDDLVDGGDGLDLLFQKADVDFKFQNDKLFGSSVDTVSGFEDLELVGGDGDNRIDLRHWMFGETTVDGGGGDDRIYGGGLGDFLEGGDGDDVLLGRDGDDVLAGGEGDDTLRGEHGNDSLDGGAGDDKLDGGHDTDTCVHGEDVKHCE